MTGRHIAAWLLLLPLAIGNGWLREATYGRVLSELLAHQVSTASLLVLIGLFSCLLARRYPLAGVRRAWLVGMAWSALTVAFEFAFGHFLIGHSWERLWRDYDILSGRVWGLFVVCLLLLPVLSHRRCRR